MPLVPVDYDPFADSDDQVSEAGGQAFLGAGRAIAGDVGDVAGGMLQTAAIPGQVWKGELQPGTPEFESAARQFAGTFGQGVAPGGSVAAGVARRALGGAETPIDATLAQNQFIDELRQMHQARDDGLPLSGAAQPIAPPPHITSHDDMAGLVGRYADLAQQGEAAKDWYLDSGRAIAAAAGDTDRANKFAAALAGTSSGTDVASNLQAAVTMHNQAMVGDPLSAGRWPQAMGKQVSGAYYGDDPLSGEKIGPFMGATVAEWNPDFAHTFVNDIHNMRAAEYPGTAAQQTAGGLYSGSPTLGQHNFTRILADQATDELKNRTGEDWTPSQVQAASWAAIKSRNEGAPVSSTAFNYADALGRTYGQGSWESAPGQTSANLPEYFDAKPEDQQAFHAAIRGALVDDQGRDLIAQHLGLLTGPSLDAPGVFQGAVSPGTQSQIALGQAPGGWRAGVDPASRDLMNTAEATRGLLLRQDAAAWHKPSYAAGIGMKDANLADIRMGRPLDDDEALAVTQGMADRTGTDFFSPIGTAQGYRFLNVPEASGLSNQVFQKHVRDLVASDLHPETGNVNIVHAKADSGYLPNDWQESPNGEDYLGAISGTGRPDLQRASAQLLATLGPRVAQVEEDFANHLGWTPNRGSRIWETSPVIQQHAGAVIPNPPRPWLQQQRPAAPGGPLSLVPVDHDPFALGGATMGAAQ
jgi:hypothetical protein